MDLVHIWHNDRYWSQHFHSTITTWSHINRCDVHGVARVNGVVMTSCERDVVIGLMWRGWSHVNQPVVVWTGWSCVNEVVPCELVIVVVMCERGGHIWTRCGRVNEEDVWTESGVIHFISSFWLDIMKVQQGNIFVCRHVDLRSRHQKQ